VVRGSPALRAWSTVTSPSSKVDLAAAATATEAGCAVLALAISSIPVAPAALRRTMVIAAVMEGLVGLALLAVAQLGGDEDFLPGDP
jgi:hypothetical protein